MDKHLRIAGPNLYKIIFTIGKGQSEKMIIAYSASDIIEFTKDWKKAGTIIVELIESDISLVVLESVLP